MIAMDDIKIEFNGVDLTSYGIWSVSVDGPKPHIFAGSKNITTARAIHSSRNIVTGINYEPLSFELTLAPYNNEWTEQFVIEIFKLFDVRIYKPLRFGDDEMYYNVLPYVGSVSEMMLFAQSQGYVTIPFQCDAGHGWIDREYHFERNAPNSGIVWNINNPCNIKAIDNTYRIYPYIVVDNIEYYAKTSDNKAFVSFGLQSDIDGVLGDDGWFNLVDFPVTTEVVIDGANSQIYDTVNNVNLLEHIHDNHSNVKIWFPYLEQGDNILYHRTLTGIPDYVSYYDIHFYLTCPYMK